MNCFHCFGVLVTSIFILLWPQWRLVCWFGTLFYRKMFSLVITKTFGTWNLQNYVFAAASTAYRAYNIADYIGSVECARANGACHVQWKSHCPYLPRCSRTAISEYIYALYINFKTLCCGCYSQNEHCYNACKDLCVFCSSDTNMCSCGCSHYQFSFRAMIKRRAWLPWQPETSFQTQVPFVNIWLMPSRRWKELLLLGGKMQTDLQIT